MFDSGLKMEWLRLLLSKQYDEARDGFGKVDSNFVIAFSAMGLFMLARGFRPDPRSGAGPLTFNGRKSSAVEDWAPTGLDADKIDRIETMSAAGSSFEDIAKVIREEF